MSPGAKSQAVGGRKEGGDSPVPATEPAWLGSPPCARGSRLTPHEWIRRSVPVGAAAGAADGGRVPRGHGVQLGGRGPTGNRGCKWGDGVPRGHGLQLGGRGPTGEAGNSTGKNRVGWGQGGSHSHISRER
jgi:hypothetical protein